MGVEQVCIVDLIEVEDGIYAAARLIDAETAEIKKAESVSGRVSTMSQVTTTATKLANLLVAGKPVNQVEGTVVENKTPTQPAARDENEHQMLKDAFAQGYIQFENLEIQLQSQCLQSEGCQESRQCRVQIPWQERLALSYRFGGREDHRLYHRPLRPLATLGCYAARADAKSRLVHPTRRSDRYQGRLRTRVG